jgi:hypothetical protein
MRWLIELETNDDPISACRLMNILRRKGLKIVMLSMGRRNAGFALGVVVEFEESELGHIFHFLRRTEGVERVTCYRQDASTEASFLLVNADAESSTLAEVMRALPELKLMFSSPGKYLLEVPSGTRLPSAVAGGREVVPFVRVLTSERATQPEPAGAVFER